MTKLTKNHDAFGYDTQDTLVERLEYLSYIEATLSRKNLSPCINWCRSFIKEFCKYKYVSGPAIYEMPFENYIEMQFGTPSKKEDIYFLQVRLEEDNTINVWLDAIYEPSTYSTEIGFIDLDPALAAKEMRSRIYKKDKVFRRKE